LRRSFSVAIIEETLTKKPYVKTLTQLLLEDKLTKTHDQQKIARECLKNLTSEDFVQLY